MSTAIRVGKISSIDYAAGTARVAYSDRDNEVTAPMPMLSHEYEPPEIGAQVIVLCLSSGGGVVLGKAWSEKNPPPEGTAGLYRKDLGNTPGQAVIRYDGGTLSISCTGGIKISAAGAVTINGASIDLN